LGTALRAGAPAEAYNRRLLKYYIGRTDQHGDANGDHDRTGEKLGNTIANATATFVLHNTDREIIHIQTEMSSCGTTVLTQAFDRCKFLAGLGFN
jgi:hypothetical protein